VFALTVVATLSGPAGAQETDPSQELAISAVFPEGPPDDATVVDADTLSFEQGDVMLQVGITAFGDCPDFWVCLWADSNYSGQMIQFKDPTTTWHNLSDYGFNDQMSSWRNHKNKDAKWTWDSGGGGTERCMQANSSSSFVGSGDNDEASSIRIFGSDTAC
jgi:hypothetical protein